MATVVPWPRVRLLMLSLAVAGAFQIGRASGMSPRRHILTLNNSSELLEGPGIHMGQRRSGQGNGLGAMGACPSSSFGAQVKFPNLAPRTDYPNAFLGPSSPLLKMVHQGVRKPTTPPVLLTETSWVQRVAASCPNLKGLSC